CLLEDRSPIAPLQGMSAAVPILCVAGQYDLAHDFIRRFSISEPPRSNDPAAREPVTPTSSQYPGAPGPDVARCHYSFFALGDAWALRRHAQRALKLGGIAGEPRVIQMAQVYEAVALWKLGDAEEGVRRLEEACAAAAARGLQLVEQFGGLFLVEAFIARGAIDEAEALLRRGADARGVQSALWGAVWSIASAQIARRRRGARERGAPHPGHRRDVAQRRHDPRLRRGAAPGSRRRGRRAPGARR